MSAEKAITKKDGPCVILAGAGTGKTYTIVEKIKYLIKNKIYSPERIVCITFSNEAAKNLLGRIENSIDIDKSRMPVIKTFHAFSSDLLRSFGDIIGINKEFKIIEPDEAKVLLFKNLRVPAGNCHKYISSIGIMKDLGVRVEDLKDYLDKTGFDFSENILEKRRDLLQFQLNTLHLSNSYDKKFKKNLEEEIAKLQKIIDLKKFYNAWNAYEKIKLKNNYLDYSDLNKKALELLKADKKVADNFDYIVVDEFQDTNKVQLEFLFEICRNSNITIVGDLNQSIYRFRGAYRENFKLFKEYFSVSSNDIFNLDLSYRSTNKILKVAHDLIIRNYENASECFFVKNFYNIEGENIEVYETANGKEEARKIVEIIMRECEKGASPEEICVLFRTHQQGRIIKNALEIADIDYCAVGKGNLLKQFSVRMAVNYLIVLDALSRKVKGGEQAWWDLFYNSGFSSEDLIKIGNFIKESKGKDNFSLLVVDNLINVDLSEKGKFIARIIIERIKNLLSNISKPLEEFVQDIFYNAGLVSRGKAKEDKEIVLNLSRFHELTKSYADLYGRDLYGFVNYLEILSSLGIEIESVDVESKGVRLMTSHATKGLEYKVVILTNMVQKRFPLEKYSSNNLIPAELLPEIKEDIRNMDKLEKEYFIKEYESKQQLLEERRLAYVGFTRAKSKLILTYAQYYGGRKYFPSQFLNEISYRNNRDIKFEQDLELKNEDSFFVIKENSEKVKEEFNFVSNGDNVQKGQGYFSPSSLTLFEDCQKKFEYKYVYNMPEKKSLSWEDMLLGSFVHKVLEEGVKKNFLELKDFFNLARGLKREEIWEKIDLDEAEKIINVFFERNKGKYNENSLTEQKLIAEIAGLKFLGFADRIDRHGELIDIIDYKTGKSVVPAKNRNWQLGYYAIAASKIGKVRRITLDMLKHDKPLEFEIDDKGNAVSINSSVSFNIYEVEEELIRTAHSVQQAYKNGFKPCSIEANCEFCNEYVYGI